MIGGEAVVEGELIGGHVSDEGNQKKCTTNWLVAKEPKSRSTECQRLDEEGLTLKERVSHKLSEEAVLLSTPFHGSVLACNKLYQVDDMAKLVMEVEFSNSLCAPNVALGQKGSLTAQYSNVRDYSLAQEEEGVGENSPMGRALRCEVGKRSAGSGTRADSQEVRQLEQGHDPSSVPEKNSG